MLLQTGKNREENRKTWSVTQQLCIVQPNILGLLRCIVVHACGNYLTLAQFCEEKPEFPAMAAALLIFPSFSITAFIIKGEKSGFSTSLL